MRFVGLFLLSTAVKNHAVVAASSLTNDNDHSQEKSEAGLTSLSALRGIANRSHSTFKANPSAGSGRDKGSTLMRASWKLPQFIDTGGNFHERLLVESVSALLEDSFRPDHFLDIIQEATRTYLDHEQKVDSINPHHRALAHATKALNSLFDKDNANTPKVFQALFDAVQRHLNDMDLEGTIAELQKIGMKSGKIIDYPIDGVMDDLGRALSEVFIDAEEAVKTDNKLDVSSLLLKVSAAVENYFKKQSLLSSELSTRLFKDATDLINPYQAYPFWFLYLVLLPILIITAPFWLPKAIFETVSLIYCRENPEVEKCSTLYPFEAMVFPFIEVAVDGIVGIYGSARFGSPPYTFEWDLDNDSNFGETGASAERGDEEGEVVTFSATGLTVGEYPITLRVTDDAGNTAEDSTVVRVYIEE